MLTASADSCLGEVTGVIHTQAVPAAAAAPLPLPSNLTALNPSAQPRSSNLSQDFLLSSTFLIPPPPIPSSLSLNSSSSLSLLAPLTCTKSLTDRPPVSLLELDKFCLLTSGPMTASKASSTGQSSSFEAKGAADKNSSINALSPIRRSLPSLDLASLGQWKNHHSTYSTAVQSIGSMTIPEALYNLNPLTESKSKAASEVKSAKTSKDQGMRSKLLSLYHRHAHTTYIHSVRSTTLLTLFLNLFFHSERYHYFNREEEQGGQAGGWEHESIRYQGCSQAGR